MPFLSSFVLPLVVRGLIMGTFRRVVQRDKPGRPTTVHLIVADGCGDWSTFVGGGAAAGF